MSRNKKDEELLAADLQMAFRRYDEAIQSGLNSSVVPEQNAPSPSEGIIAAEKIAEAEKEIVTDSVPETIGQTDPVRKMEQISDGMPTEKPVSADHAAIEDLEQPMPRRDKKKRTGKRLEEAAEKARKLIVKPEINEDSSEFNCGTNYGYSEGLTIESMVNKPQITIPSEKITIENEVNDHRKYGENNHRKYGYSDRKYGYSEKITIENEVISPEGETEKVNNKQTFISLEMEPGAVFEADFRLLGVSLRKSRRSGITPSMAHVVQSLYQYGSKQQARSFTIDFERFAVQCGISKGTASKCSRALQQSDLFDLFEPVPRSGTLIILSGSFLHSPDDRKIDKELKSFYPDLDIRAVLPVLSLLLSGCRYEDFTVQMLDKVRERIRSESRDLPLKYPQDIIAASASVLSVVLFCLRTGKDIQNFARYITVVLERSFSKVKLSVSKGLEKEAEQYVKTAFDLLTDKMGEKSLSEIKQAAAGLGIKADGRTRAELEDLIFEELLKLAEGMNR